MTDWAMANPAPLRYARSADAIGAAVGDAVMVLNTANGDIYHLNAVGAFIWRALEAASTLDDLRAAAATHFQRADDAAVDIEEFVGELVARGLVVARATDAAP
jgi:hypothetical protein